MLVLVSYPGSGVKGPIVLRLEVEVDHHHHSGQDVDDGQAHLGQAQPHQPVPAQDGGAGAHGRRSGLKAAVREAFN